MRIAVHILGTEVFAVECARPREDPGSTGPADTELADEPNPFGFGVPRRPRKPPQIDA